jgi:hypothetical protein
MAKARKKMVSIDPAAYRRIRRLADKYGTTIRRVVGLLAANVDERRMTGKSMEDER